MATFAENNDGTGGASIYGAKFSDENLQMKMCSPLCGVKIPLLCTRSHFYESLHFHRKSERQVFST